MMESRGGSGDQNGLETWGKRSFWIIGIVGLVILALWLYAELTDFILPALIGLVLAITLSPLVGWMERRRIHRAVGALIVGVVVLAAFGVLAWVALDVIIAKAPEFVDALYQAVLELGQLFGREEAAQDAAAAIKQADRDTLDILVHGVLPFFLEGTFAGLNATFFVFSVLLYLMFMLWDGPRLRGWVEHLSRLSPQNGRALTNAYTRSTRRYFAGMTLVAAINFIIIVPVAIIVKCDLWIIIGVVVFLGTYIPYVGGIGAGLLSFMLALGTEGFDAAIAVGIALLVINILIQPNIQTFAVGAALRLRPLAVFALAMLGIALAGAFGGAAAAPLARIILDTQHVYRAERDGEMLAPDWAAKAIAEADRDIEKGKEIGAEESGDGTD